MFRASHILPLLFLLVLSPAFLGYGQVGNVDASNFTIAFKQGEIEFKKNEIVSNPLQVVNNSTRPMKFSLEASLPPGWAPLGSSNRLYTVQPGDSMFVPFRVIPKGTLAGNTKYSINVMLRSEDGLPLGVGSFFCFTKKIVKWEMSVLPESKIYFKNGEDISQFSVELLNIGNYAQDFQLTLNGGDREDLLLLDTFDNVVRSPTYTLPLDAGRDTTLSFKVKPTTFKRNSRTVSLISHRPESELEERRFRFYAVSEQAKQVKSGNTKKGAKVDFIKLANSKEVSPFGADHFPLVAEAQIQNILSDYSFMSLNLRGIKQFDRDRRLVYFTQLYYSQSYFNPEQFKNTPWYVGYFDKKWDIQVGQVNGRAMGVLSSGKGVTGSYQVAKHHRVGAHFTQSPGLADRARITSYGVYHDYTGQGRIRVSSTLARSEDQQVGIGSNVASSRVNVRVASNHNVSLLGAYSIRQFRDTALSQTGFLTSLTYSGSMINKRLRVTLNGRYNTPTFGITTSERFAVTNRTTFQVNESTQLQLLNTANTINRYQSRFSDSIQYTFQTYFNRLNVAFRTDRGVFQPGVFYDITETVNYTNHYRGFAFTYSNFNFRRNLLYTTSIKLGYNNPLNFPEISEYFTGSISLLTRIRTFTMNMRYNYGPSSPTSLARLSNNTYPQQFRGSLQHQYMFKNTHFILQSGMNYSYANQINSHSLSLFPELFYFTSSGWRFSVNMNYTFGSSNFQKATNDLNPIRNLEDSDPGPTVSNTVRFGASIRKEFGIPVPFSRHKNYDLDFIAFYDLNGNGYHDSNEPTIENVVIRLENQEVITNLRGEADLKNMPAGVYSFTPISLNETDGWFAEVSDSVLVDRKKTVQIPFARGVKVSGKVVMDRDQLVTGEDERFDLSNIKITATNGQAYHTLTGFDGSFELFLPNGSYTISVDENILTERFRLLQNNMQVTLDEDMENLFVTFFIIEKRRKVNVKKFGPK